MRDGFLGGAPPSDRAAVSAAIALLAVAAASAPRSCDWGLSVYVAAGIIASQMPWLILLFPRARRAQASRWLRVLLGVTAVAALWVLLFFVFPFRLMCRLF